MKKIEHVLHPPSKAMPPSDLELDPCYADFFQCFNRQEYFEAHEVLESLWLKCRDGNQDYFKGLIQVAGAFVHLQKQFQRPGHRVDGRRLHPAERLLKLGLRNLEHFRPHHLRCDVESLCQLCARHAGEITASDFQHNPWHPSHAPQIHLTRRKMGTGS